MKQIGCVLTLVVMMAIPGFSQNSQSVSGTAAATAVEIPSPLAALVNHYFPDCADKGPGSSASMR
jgi:hypothetical protein